MPIFYPEGVEVIRQRPQVAGLEQTALMANNALRSAEALADLGSAGIGTYFVSEYTPPAAGLQACADAYKQEYGIPPEHSTYGYGADALNLLLTAIEHSAVQSRDGSLVIPRQGLRDALAAIQDYPGLTGTLSCSSHGDCSRITIVVVQIIDPAGGLEGLAKNIVFEYQPVNK